MKAALVLALALMGCSDAAWPSKWYFQRIFAWRNLKEITRTNESTLEKCKARCMVYDNCRAFNYGIKGTTIKGQCQLFEMPDSELQFSSMDWLPTKLAKDEYWVAYYRMSGTNNEDDQYMGSLCQHMDKCSKYWTYEGVDWGESVNSNIMDKRVPQRMADEAAAAQSRYLLLAAGGAGVIVAAGVVGWLKQRLAVKEAGAEIGV